MNETFSLEQRSKTGNLDSSLLLRHYELDLTATFMEMKSLNPELTEKKIAKELGYPNSRLKRYRKDINMLSPYRFSSNITNKRRQKISNANLDDISNREHDLKRPQMTSKESFLYIETVKRKIKTN